MLCTRFPRETAIVVAIALALGVLLAWNLLATDRGLSPVFQANMQRLHVLEAMRLNLAAAEEAEKSAVLADPDEDSQAFAQESRTRSQAVEDGRIALEALLAQGGSAKQKSLLLQFSRAFVELRQIDQEILDLAVRNTNLKAFALAFGPAARALDEFNQCLIALADANRTSHSSRDVLLQAFIAQSGLLKIQTFLALHVMEAQDEKMDCLEADMSLREADADSALESLAGLDPLEGKDFLVQARAAFERYLELKRQILTLSRENTNVRSMALSLSKKRKISAACQEALGALEEDIRNQDFRATR